VRVRASATLSHDVATGALTYVKGRDRVPDVAIHTFFKYFEAPTKSEGFTSIVNVPFVPRFNDAEAKQMFEMRM
jgi:hypothetical protein